MYFRDMAYAVVTFKKDKSVSEVPSCWVVYDDDNNESFCWWPPQSTKQIRQLIIKKATPDTNLWDLLEVSVETYCGNIQTILVICVCVHYFQ